MAALIGAVCSALVILAFCQILVETILPEGGTKRYVMFITGLVAVIVIVSTLTLSGSDMMKAVYTKTAEMKDIADKQQTPEGVGQTNPYKEYIEKLIESYR